MRISSGIHQKTGSLQILSKKISCRHRREDNFHGYPHDVAGVEMWACHQIDLYQVLVQNYQFLQSDGIQGADWKTSKRRAPMFKNFD